MTERTATTSTSSKKRKASTISSFNKNNGNKSPWKQVEVFLGGNAEQQGAGNTHKQRKGRTALTDFNHYDNDPPVSGTNTASTSTAKKSAEWDLEGQPGEHVGIFLGLEVLDSKHYQIERTQDGIAKFRMLNDDDSNNDTNCKSKQRKDDKKSANNDEVRRKQEHNTSSIILPKTTTTSSTMKTHLDKDQNEQDHHEDQLDNPSSSKRRKKKKKAKNSSNSKEEDDNTSRQLPKSDSLASDQKEEQETSTAHDHTEMIESIQLSWLLATGGVLLHSQLCTALSQQKFWNPTPIQAATLPAAILGQRNIVGAAPTGSGKTLAFLLPIGQYYYENVSQVIDHPTIHNESTESSLQALIMAPTRELCIQIKNECIKLLPSKEVGIMVGGLAHAKQSRVLHKERPLVIIGTVGRLWELISSREYPHLNDLSQIRFLVIDEADRMIQQGSFPQLSLILDAVQRANPQFDDDDDTNDGDESLDDPETEDDYGRMLSLPGVKGEARVAMLSNDILSQIQAQRNEQNPESLEVNDEDFNGPDASNEENESEDELSLPLMPPVRRITFVFSATLTLPASTSFDKRRKKRQWKGVDGAIAEILEKAHAKGPTKIVDLSNVSSSGTQVKAGRDTQKARQEEKCGKKFQLPPGLTLKMIQCTRLHKDSHLYAYLMTESVSTSGPCLVFCNSIAGVRRVSSTLQTLGMEVRALHAHMQQRSRLKVLETLRQAKSRVVLVATDVAARGLDLPLISTVIHYDAARNVDTFVHRSGRTARGVGNAATGCSLSLVSSDEDKLHSTIARTIQAKFDSMLIDGRLLSRAQERVNLASKIVSAETVESRTKRSNQWLEDAAEEMDLVLDDDLLESGLAEGDQRDQSRLREAKLAKSRLKILLAQPLRAKRFGKFLSTSAH